MRVFPFAALVLAMVAFAAAADDVKDLPDEAPKTVVKKEYAEFSKLIHKMVIKELPKEIEDASGWGKTIPIPDRIRFPGLQRTLIKVGDKLEMPHGTWRRFKVKIDDPDKDIQITLKEFSKIDPKTFRLVVDADALLQGVGEVKHWQKGLSLLGATAHADALFGLAMVIDVGVTLNTQKFPPDLVIEPKVTDLKVDLKEFNLRRVGNSSPQIIEIGIEGAQAQQIGNDLKGHLQSMIKNFEPQIKERFNEAVAQSLKEGKGTISAGALLKAAGPALKPAAN